MSTIRLAVIFDQRIFAGGGYQQALNAALLTQEIPVDIAQVIFFTTFSDNVSTLASYGIEAEFIPISAFGKIRSYIRSRINDLQVLSLLQRFEEYLPLEKCMVERNIDLVYFLSPSGWTRSLERLNYITTVWDLCHRDDPEFPEVSSNRQLESRDSYYRSTLPRATAIFVDSELGKKNVIRRYAIDEQRIYILPFQPAVSTYNPSLTNSESVVDVRKRYQLDVPYVFYPAQFWSHKNHIYLLEGLRALDDLYSLKVGAVFSGVDKGNLQFVQTRTFELGLDDRVRFVGFVPNEEIPYFYRQSLALVMPTYFGPTNLPPLEAFILGVPVLYSDKEGLRDQVGEAGLMMDLSNPESMAFHIKSLTEDDQLRSNLIKEGFKRLAYINSIDRIGILLSVIQKFSCRRKCWPPLTN